MSGQGVNLRGGRGNHRRPSPQVKTINDYYFYVGSNRQASDYETTIEYIVNHIKKTFDEGNDVAEALRTLQAPNTDKWKPTLYASREPDPDMKTLQNKQFEHEYKAELNETLRRIRTYRNNMYKAYALLWDRCAKAMQNLQCTAEIYAITNFY
mmetsp:Transcript_27248/g.38543  ORF Transcript_27248/g.38543 Transcript_27248/m.38543 type:complete len:153 (-) Transcript_27248:24-482(-)|eukprot:CAMPEP_0202453048 /NCGR_PEP_ID=MMETSP1360-20130828/11116_1 /ASSEMBLY_ACC=CAM_ASM_000848 /TAXON_ID=515479 /ORGANISM="Licmophora paradoxa, Strain CCMP2313" /LENGTH=152 /DNA_ID=CAMNT_0049072037 /DNA_START=68 /DNA_END=526 /DNA_ORIENTATION=+